MKKKLNEEDLRWALNTDHAELDGVLVKGLGAAILATREDRQVSRPQVQEKLGIHSQRLYRAEKKGGELTIAELVGLCDLLEIDPQDLERLAGELSEVSA